jgi:hypothetical protein
VANSACLPSCLQAAGICARTVILASNKFNWCALRFFMVAASSAILHCLTPYLSHFSLAYVTSNLLGENCTVNIAC